jgi:hypothetical protein
MVIAFQLNDSAMVIGLGKSVQAMMRIVKIKHTGMKVMLIMHKKRWLLLGVTIYI